MRRAFFVITIAIVLLFTVMSLYPILYPIHHFDAACGMTDGRTAVFQVPRTALDEFHAISEKHHLKCSLTPVRSWFTTGPMWTDGFEISN
jgi:hypothetical protein